MNQTEKLAALRRVMKRMGLAAVIVPTGDPHCSEYTAHRFQDRAWLTGFTGSMGTAVVTEDSAALWVDGRYIVQAREQTEAAGYRVYLEGGPDSVTLEEYLGQKLPLGGKAAVCGARISATWGRELMGSLQKRRISLVTELNMVEQIRPGVPEMPGSRIWELEPEYAGASAREKLDAVRQEMARVGATHYVISSLDDIAWLTNLRGDDIPYFPVNYAFMIVEPQGARLFVAMRKLTTGVGQALAEAEIGVEEYATFFSQLEQLPADSVAALDPNRNSFTTLAHIRVPVVEIAEFTRAMKCVKNSAETAHMKQAALADGAAMVRFLMDFEHRLMNGETLREGDLAAMLTCQRKKDPHYVEESFHTIAAYGPHGAMMHYAPGEDGGAVLEPHGLLVLDSGAHYLDGSTDITRTLSLGQLTEQEKRDFTMVLKSHIALATCVFPEGASGHHLDALARRVIWDEGMNYRCGTGHGVGYLLHVHEDPCRIAPGAVSCPLKPGMVLTNEPGIYREGEHGVRTENMVLVEEAFTNEYGRFLRLAPLTWCPIDTSALDPELLDARELAWLDDYHATVCEHLAPLLTEEECAWLEQATRPLLKKGRRGRRE